MIHLFITKSREAMTVLPLVVGLIVVLCMLLEHWFAWLFAAERMSPDQSGRSLPAVSAAPLLHHENPGSQTFRRAGWWHRFLWADAWIRFDCTRRETAAGTTNAARELTSGFADFCTSNIPR